MKKFNKFVTLLLALFTLSLSGCDFLVETEHTHTFSSNWSSDSTYHWHASTCGHDVVDGKAEHTFGEWEEKITATEERPGRKVRTCTICGYEDDVIIPVIQHQHTYSDQWSSNATHHWHAATCGHNVNQDYAEHAFGEWDIVSSATETATGLKRRTCSVCGYVDEVVIPKLEHVHTFENTWTSDETYHWHASTCGHDVVDGKAEHEFGNWITDDEPTATEEGSKHRTCSICGYVEEDIIPVIGHVHTFNFLWSANETHHWHAATCGHNLKEDYGEHEFSDWTIDSIPTTTSSGAKHRTCSVCGYVDNEVMPQLTDGIYGLIKGQTLADLFADTAGNDVHLYEITGVVYDWKSPYTDGTMYGNFLIKENKNSTKYYTIWGCTATESALTYSLDTNTFVFTNPRDFLTNDVTSNIEIGDTVTMWLSRCDNGSYIEAHGIVKSVQKQQVLPDTGTLTLDVYATNDIHGQIESDTYRLDLATLGTFMKSKGQEDNTLLLDQGDSWQGSIYSNFNRGALVNDVMSIAQYDARTVGNHDFDWGLDALKANTARSYNGYTIPVLAANVYDYNFSTKTEGNTLQTDIGQKTVKYALKNGLTVGIVGIIGQDQITSITSSYVETICFKNHVPIIKEEATRLRNEGCDIVILSAHTGQESLTGNGLEDYVDLALCGHTHMNETTNEGDLYYAQFGSYANSVGHITLTYDLSTKKVSNTNIVTMSKNQVQNSVSAIDSQISQVVNQYNSECSAEANVVLASNADSFAKGSEAVNLMCQAIMDRCISEGYNNVILSYCNTARKDLPSGTWTYADIYNSFPFDNTVYIVNVKGSDILNEVKKFNNVCYNTSFNYYIDSNQYYQIACLDYLLYHTNSNRYYNYFNSFTGVTVGELSKNYRIILREWLLANGYNSGKALNSGDYSNSVDRFNRSNLYS